MAKKPKFDPSKQINYTGSLGNSGYLEAGAVTANDIAMQNAPRDPINGSPLYTREMLAQKAIEDQIRRGPRDVAGETRSAFESKLATSGPSPYTSHVGENISTATGGKVVNGKWIPNQPAVNPQGLPDAVRQALPAGGSTLPAPAVAAPMLPNYIKPATPLPVPAVIPQPGNPTPQITGQPTVQQPTVPQAQNPQAMQRPTPAAYSIKPSGGNFNGTLRKLGIRLPGYMRR